MWLIMFLEFALSSPVRFGGTLILIGALGLCIPRSLIRIEIRKSEEEI